MWFNFFAHRYLIHLELICICGMTPQFPIIPPQLSNFPQSICSETCPFLVVLRCHLSCPRVPLRPPPRCSSLPGCSWRLVRGTGVMCSHFCDQPSEAHVKRESSKANAAKCHRVVTLDGRSLQGRGDFSCGLYISETQCWEKNQRHPLGEVRMVHVHPSGESSQTWGWEPCSSVCALKY